MLNESLFPLGLTKNPNVAPIQGQFQFDEKKKNMDKNPEMEDDEDYEEDEDEKDEDEDSDDDGDNKEDNKPSKKDCDDESPLSAFMKKKGMKKKMKNECDCEDKKPLESDNDDDDEEDDEVDADEDKGDEDEEMGEKGGDMKRPLGFMKKKGMKKKMKKEATNPQNDFLQSFNSYTAPGNQMSSEDTWWNSVQGHFSNPNQKFNDGFTEYMEDYLIDPEAQQHFTQGNSQQHNSKPGEVGHAPEGRVGQSDFFGS